MQAGPVVRSAVPRTARKIGKETEFSDQVTTYTKPLSAPHSMDNSIDSDTSGDQRKNSTTSHDFSSTEKMNEDIDMALAEVCVDLLCCLMIVILSCLVTDFID